MKKVISLIGIVVIVIIAITFGILQADTNNEKMNTKDTTVYTLQQALSDEVYTESVDVEEKSLSISTNCFDESFNIQDSEELVFSKETEQNLINQMLQWKLIKFDDFDLTKSFIRDSHYSAYLTVRKRHRLYLDSIDKTLYIYDDSIKQGYKIQNSRDYFTILDEIKKENPNKEL